MYAFMHFPGIGKTENAYDRIFGFMVKPSARR